MLAGCDLPAGTACRLHGSQLVHPAAASQAPQAPLPPAHSQLEDPWRLLPIQALVDIGMKDMQA